MPANGTASATITVTLLDASSNPVVGHTVTLDDGAASSTIGAASGPSNASGQVTFPVTNTTVEVATYTAMDTTNAVTVTQTAQVNFTMPPASVTDAGTSTVVANPANPTPVPANGTASATITVTLLDASSNPVVGHTVTLDDGAASSTIGAASGPSNASGQVTFPVTNTTVEVATYTAMDTTNAVTVTQTAQVNFTTPPAGVIITGLTPASYVPVAAPPGLQVGDRIYIDRTYTFTTVPALVQGEAYIRTANAHKTNATNPFLTFTVDQPVTVYVAHDKRIVLKPSWFPSLGFVDSGENLVTTDAEFDLFVASFPAGPIQLGGNESPGGASSMYSVIVQSQGSPPPPTDAGTSTVVANPANPTPVPANGTASATITVTLLDASSNPVVGHTVTLDDGAASSTIGAASGPSNASGQVTFPVTNTTVEVATYTAMDTTNAVTVTQTAQVNFTMPPASVTDAALQQ